MTPEVPRPQQPQLMRAIGRWSMVALALNSILGSGIFGLPSVLARLLGSASILAVLLAGVGMTVIIACYAEVASQFTATGGTYLYLRTVFGRFTGILVGWMMVLTRLTACAAAVNLLVVYLAEFWPQARAPGPRLLVISVFIGTLAAVNYRGVAAGARVSSFAVLAKLLALGVVCVAGVEYLLVHPLAIGAPRHADAREWLQALLLLLFAYGGYEAALNPSGEVKNPRRDLVFALFVAVAVLTVLYTLLQFIVLATLPQAAHSERPLADAARVLMGTAGARLVAAGALVSVYGYVSANLLTAPRGIFALAQQRDFPAPFAAIHPRFSTPYLSIVTFALLVILFAQFADFSWNVTLSAVARLFYYGAICVAVPLLRSRQPQAAAFRVPGGLLFPAAGVGICLALAAAADFSNWLILLAIVAAACGNWFLVRKRAVPPAATDA
jgi:basic amino acid/polyamine antiporter, APA family